MFHFFKKNKENYWEITIIIILQLCTKYFDVWSKVLRYDGLKLVILGHSLPFYSPKNQNNLNFEKNDINW